MEAQTLPGMTEFVFNSKCEQILPGRTSKVSLADDDAEISFDDVMDTIAIVTLRHQGDGFDSGDCVTSAGTHTLIILLKEVRFHCRRHDC